MHTHVHTHVRFVYVREHAPDKDVRMFSDNATIYTMI